MIHDYSAYANGTCRCTVCSTAWADYIYQRAATRKAWVEVNGLPASVEHGRSAYSNWGCHCDICTAANTEAGRKHRARKAKP